MAPTQQPPKKNWCYTVNNYTDEETASLDGLYDSGKVVYHIYGFEVAPETGTPHLQGFITLAKKARLTAVKKIPGLERAHLTAANGTPADSRVYIAENPAKPNPDFKEFGELPAGERSRTDLEDFKAAVKGGELSVASLMESHSEVCARYPRFVTEYLRFHTPKPPVESHPLRPWQAELNAMLNREPDRRSIHFFVDRTGNSGKSWFCDYYASLHDDVFVMEPGKKADMALAYPQTTRVMFLDCPRSKQGDFIQYDFLEAVKNGRIFSGKYESGMKYMRKAHVVVMMNEHPDMEKLSSDRYLVKDI